MFLTKIQAYDAGQQVVDTFYGLNRAEKIQEGEFSDELNMTSDRFPMLSVRKKRSVVMNVTGYIVSMLAKDKLYVVWVDTSASIPDYPNLRLCELIRKDDDSWTTLKSWTFDKTQTVVKSAVSFGAYIIIPGLDVWYNTADSNSSTNNGTITDMPEMDFVIECNNRLWGCKYGMVDGETINEIYASELGDFTSWDNYDGTSMASYAASVGTDGPWTGAISYQGRPHFFKEKYVHKVYISATGAHQIVETPILGVQENCQFSLAALNGVLYYMSRDGVCAYDGSTPTVISKALGDLLVEYAFFGGCSGKLYALIDEIGTSGTTPRLYTYDVRRGIWHQENNEFGLSAAFAALGDSFYICNAALGLFTPGGSAPTVVLRDENGVDGTKEGDVLYSCTTGLIGWQNVEQKYVSRFDMRLTLPEGATMKVEIEYDSSGTWEEQGTVTGGGTGSIMIPVKPRRCDHFRIRLSGKGEMRMFSFAKRLLKGSDVV